MPPIRATKGSPKHTQRKPAWDISPDWRQSKTATPVLNVSAIWTGTNWMKIAWFMNMDFICTKCGFPSNLERKIIVHSNWEICSGEGRIRTVDPVDYLAVVPDVSTTHLKFYSKFLLNFQFVSPGFLDLCHLAFWREEGGIERGLSSSVNGQGCLGTFATEKEKWETTNI